MTTAARVSLAELHPRGALAAERGCSHRRGAAGAAAAPSPLAALLGGGGGQLRRLELRGPMGVSELAMQITARALVRGGRHGDHRTTHSAQPLRVELEWARLETLPPRQLAHPTRPLTRADTPLIPSRRPSRSHRARVTQPLPSDGREAPRGGAAAARWIVCGRRGARVVCALLTGGARQARSSCGRSARGGRRRRGRGRGRCRRGRRSLPAPRDRNVRQPTAAHAVLGRVRGGSRCRTAAQRLVASRRLPPVRLRALGPARAARPRYGTRPMRRTRCRSASLCTPSAPSALRPLRTLHPLPPRGSCTRTTRRAAGTPPPPPRTSERLERC